MAYVCSNVADLSAVNNELRKIAEALNQRVPFLYLDTLYAAPSKPRDGILALADGTTWNPGSGAGVYLYRAGAWRFLG